MLLPAEPADEDLRLSADHDSFKWLDDPDHPPEDRLPDPPRDDRSGGG